MTFNEVVPNILETSGTNSSLLLRKEKPTRKMKRESKELSWQNLLKSHIIQIQNFIAGKLQSPQRVTKSFFTSQKLQLAKPFVTSANTRSRQKPQEREREREGEREREREGERVRKRERERKEERKKDRESGTSKFSL